MEMDQKWLTADFNAYKEDEDDPVAVPGK